MSLHLSSTMLSLITQETYLLVSLVLLLDQLVPAVHLLSLLYMENVNLHTLYSLMGFVVHIQLVVLLLVNTFVLVLVLFASVVIVLPHMLVVLSVVVLHIV